MQSILHVVLNVCTITYVQYYKVNELALDMIYLGTRLCLEGTLSDLFSLYILPLYGALKGPNTQHSGHMGQFNSCFGASVNNVGQ